MRSPGSTPLSLLLLVELLAEKMSGTEVRVTAAQSELTPAALREPTESALNRKTNQKTPTWKAADQAADKAQGGSDSDGKAHLRNAFDSAFSQTARIFANERSRIWLAPDYNLQRVALPLSSKFRERAAISLRQFCDLS